MRTGCAGYVHDVVAVREVGLDRVNLLGRPSQEHSWFPGYAWTITNCAACGAHLARPFWHPSVDRAPSTLMKGPHDLMSY
jgi:cereblon